MATGAISGFDAEDFRRNIRLAMTVGLPPVSSDQPIFVFAPDISNVQPADQDEVPFDPEARPVTVPRPSVKVPCAIEYFDAAGKVENFGVIVPSKVVLTLLDDEYERVRGFQYVIIGGDRYFYSKTAAPLGLDAVGIWQIHCTAEDDT